MRQDHTGEILLEMSLTDWWIRSGHLKNVSDFLLIDFLSVKILHLSGAESKLKCVEKESHHCEKQREGK